MNYKNEHDLDYVEVKDKKTKRKKGQQIVSRIVKALENMGYKNVKAKLYEEGLIETDNFIYNLIKG